VVGYDVNKNTIDLLQNGKSHIFDVPEEAIKQFVNTSFFPTDDPLELKKCNIIIICVPTPLTEERIPDLSYIKSACETVAGILNKDQFVILESTTYPGTTEEVVIPIIEESGLKAGIDFGVAYSPERIDPGNKQFTVNQVPKVVGGMNNACTEVAAALYGNIISEIVPVRDMRTAESVKMRENIFRNVNIALVNEMALIFERMGIDTLEVIDAAATKPYGLMPFYPVPGVGGHYITLDPFYMSYKAKKYGFIPRFIKTSGEINEFMKMHAVNLVEKGLAQVGKRLYGAKVTVMGLNDGCDWIAAHLRRKFNSAFSKIVATNCGSRIQNPSPTNYV
jgi:UDP-N-acetyl-D-glucosamine dehydrogenase